MEALSVLSFVILLGFSYYGAQWMKEKEGFQSEGEYDHE